MTLIALRRRSLIRDGFLREGEGWTWECFVAANMMSRRGNLIRDGFIEEGEGWAWECSVAANIMRGMMRGRNLIRNSFIRDSR